VNQDGLSASLTAPHGPSQEAVIRCALRQGQLDNFGRYDQSECHGTGTALGDPLEVGALMRVMAHPSGPPTTLGSIKTNFGHLEAAAGMAGLIKSTVICQSSVSAPNLHLRNLNSHIDVQRQGLLFATDARRIITSELIVGVSSFGFGGTNAHVIVGCERKWAPIADPPSVLFQKSQYHWRRLL
jgi:acyl transferase domain-containing protein